jgi:hypothetical protein
VRPHLSKMQVDEIMCALERAQAHAYPGRQAVERDHVLRELWQLLQQQATKPPDVWRSGA